MEFDFPGGSLVVGGPYGAARISTAGGFLKVEEVNGERGAISQSDLFQMLIGRGVDGRVPPESEEFASALFPRQETWFWSWKRSLICTA